MYRALNGDPFFEDQAPADGSLLEQKISKGKFPDRARFMPHIPLRVRSIVRKALNVNPADRFQTAIEMADALSRANLALDWSVEAIPEGGFRWGALRPNQCDLVVELAQRSAAWDVKTFTQNADEPQRAKGKGENWRKGISLNDAHSHLKEVFERLAQ
jgi:serine/threonine protein kinase